MKLGFNLVSDSKVLLVQVLRAKYGVTSGLPETIVRGRCSFLWRALAKVWPLIRENLLWSMGDGRNIRCWCDPWVPNIDPLVNWIPELSCFDLDCLLSDMVTNGGGWNLDLFQLWLPEELIKRIVGIPPSHATAETDKEWLNVNLQNCQLNCLGDVDCDIIKASYSWAKQYISVSRRHVTEVCGATPCSILSESGVCLNTEGSVRHDDGFAVVGGFVRDHDGKWLVKFNRYLGSCTVFDTELWGILDGLTCLVDRGYNNIIIQSNNLDVVKNIQEGLVEGTNSALVRIIHQMLLRLGH
ncbi:hypothetical protein Golax_000741 [Gossypium laxum]|uniref:RNase H type-1 domain-containing protein n=1 Tax=Gossypium laxum TaxID=34288 RepID=A0A7J9AUQ1_9ROSI|nr:hypothetical protein [Gossypium laxum]